MANASNNGLLPLNNGQAGGQGGYSQVSPMMSAYYNAAQAPTGNNVLGYNYGASGLMPGGVSGSSGATPTPPKGNLSISGSGSSASGSTGGYGAPAASNPQSGYNAAATGGYGANRVSSGAITGQGNYPVATQAPQNAGVSAHPMYNPAGPLASPNSHPAIPAQVQANRSGQMQGSSQAVNNPDAWSQMQPQMIPGGPTGTNHPVGPPPGAPTGTNHPVGTPIWQDPGKGGNGGLPVSVGVAGPPGKHPKPPPPKKPAPPPSALDKWLAGDTTYQQQLAEYNQEQQAYNQNYTNTKDEIGQNFNATQRSMNNQANLDRMNQQYDFAGRGVLSSGAYAQALDQYNTQFQNNIGNLVQGENQQLTANQTNLNNFLRQITLQRNAAKQDAIARRAAQLGITSG